MKTLLLLSTILFSMTAFTQNLDLLVLGTAQDAGYPQAGCEKKCCKEVKMPESVASMAIQSEGKFWIIDATPDFTKQLALCKSEFPDSEFAGIFLTHAHIGHYTGLMYLGLEAMNTNEVPIYCMPKMADFLRSNGPWSQLVEQKNIKIVEMRENQAVQISPYASVTPLIVPHRDEFSETVGFLIASKKKKALYIPDIDKWEKWSQSLVGLMKPLDFVIVDATFYDGTELPGRDMSQIPHPSVVESMEYLNELDKKDKAKVYFTHFNHTNPLLWDEAKQKSIIDSGYNLASTGKRL